MNRSVIVYGAYGHTGRFVVDELVRRGWSPVLCGRDRQKLLDVSKSYEQLEVRTAGVDDDASLDRAVIGGKAIINCAGPFARTAAPIIEAALRAQIPYFDIAAEIEVVEAVFEIYNKRASDARTILMPAMAFYGGLGDLLATVASTGSPELDEISIAYGLRSWKPTLGTRATTAMSVRRRDGKRIVFLNNEFQLRSDAAPLGKWDFPEPLGAQPVVCEFTMADTAMIARHLHVRRINSYMTATAVRDLSDDDVLPPLPVDDRGRSAGEFLVEVVARLGDDECRVWASGRDIYAVSAPLVVEAMERVVNGAPQAGGVFAAGELFDARDFLQSLSPDHLNVQLSGANYAAAGK